MFGLTHRRRTAKISLSWPWGLGARWNRLGEAVKTRKRRGETGGKRARYGLKRVNTGRDRRDQLAAAPSTTPAGWDVLIASHSLSELPLETFRMYLAALSGRYAYVLYCTQVEWPTVEESSLKRSLLEARYSNHRRQLIAPAVD